MIYLGSFFFRFAKGSSSSFGPVHLDLDQTTGVSLERLDLRSERDMGDDMHGWHVG